MSRMHSGSKGKSGSTKPANKEKPTWESHKPKEIEMLIAKLAKDGKTSAQIGLFLRDNYGIPDVKLVLGKGITAIMAEKGLTHEVPEDLRFLIRKALMIRKHLEENKQDQPAKRGLILTESKIKRLIKYYKKSAKLDMAWKYDFRKASTYLE